MGCDVLYRLSELYIQINMYDEHGHMCMVLSNSHNCVCVGGGGAIYNIMGHERRFNCLL